MFVAFIVRRITNRLGGNHEKAIFNSPHYLKKSDLWDKNRKVVYVISSHEDEDGCAAGYAVDLVTESICSPLQY